MPVEPATASREILLRFLTANGPATAADVARWWGEQPAPAKRWFRANADALAAVEIDGEAGYAVRAEDADELAAIPDGGADPAGWISPVLLVGWRIAGVWEPGPAPTVQPFAPLRAATRLAVDHLLASSGT